MSSETIIAIIGSVVGSSALFGFIQFMIQRRDKKHDKFEALQKSIKAVEDLVGHVRDDMAAMRDNFKADVNKLNAKIDRDSAVQARIRILRANDELRQDVHHSYEYFRQLHHDITNYEKYCDANPDFKNNEAVNSIEYINRVYQDCLDKHNFLT